MPEESSVVELSVVIAAQDSGTHLRKCLTALVAQLPRAEMEILVVDGSGLVHEIEQVVVDFPAARILRRPAESNVPQLWSAGIDAARGKIVALTIENCVPAPDWARLMLDAHKAEWAGIGGAIEIAPEAGLVDWAVYFSRYSNYIPPFAPRFLDDLAADNCSYKHEALDRVHGLMADGFWETFIHYDMRQRGERLFSEPLPVVTYCGGLSGWRFFRRRYIHGRYFAARRGRDFTLFQRLMRGAGFWIVPPLLLMRTAGRVWSNGRRRAKFLPALPLVIAFLVAWAVGESVGYLRGPSGTKRPGRD
jgi:glycosyltransferase involved in cell wall biosynthesis